MGEAARRVHRARTTPGERFDQGLELADAAQQSILARHPLPEGLSPEERARREFWILRKASHGRR